LFVDMFSLLGLSIDRKRKNLLDKYEDKINRMTNKMSLKEKNRLKQKMFDEQKAAQDKHELE